MKSIIANIALSASTWCNWSCDLRIICIKHIQVYPTHSSWQNSGISFRTKETNLILLVSAWRTGERIWNWAISKLWKETRDLQQVETEWSSGYSVVSEQAYETEKKADLETVYTTTKRDAELDVPVIIICLFWKIQNCIIIILFGLTDFRHIFQSRGKGRHFLATRSANWRENMKSSHIHLTKRNCRFATGWN